MNLVWQGLPRSWPVVCEGGPADGHEQLVDEHVMRYDVLLVPQASVPGLNSLPTLAEVFAGATLSVYRYRWAGWIDRRGRFVFVPADGP